MCFVTVTSDAMGTAARCCTLPALHAPYSAETVGSTALFMMCRATASLTLVRSRSCTMILLSFLTKGRGSALTVGAAAGGGGGPGGVVGRGGGDGPVSISWSNRSGSPRGGGGLGMEGGGSGGVVGPWEELRLGGGGPGGVLGLMGAVSKIAGFTVALSGAALGMM